MNVSATPESIEMRRLITLRGALKLEKLGMRHSRLGSVRKVVRAIDGCPKTNDFDKLIAFLTERIGF